MIDITSIDWQKVAGLLPVIIQNAQTSEVLMLGYMNLDALNKTCVEGKVTFYSRTQKRLWTKGETSGHFLHVVAMSLDCDRDTLLISVNPIGATCHTGTDSCFNQLGTLPDGVFFAKLEQLIAHRKGQDPQQSYTAQLYTKGTQKIAQKVGEEGVETALAAMTHNNNEILNEAADLVYHLTVLLQNADLNWHDLTQKLRERHQGIGLHPEGNRKSFKQPEN